MHSCLGHHIAHKEHHLGRTEPPPQVDNLRPWDVYGTPA
jgi:hypothetical protein